MTALIDYLLLFLGIVPVLLPHVASRAVWEDTDNLPCSSLRDDSGCDIYSCLDEQLGCSSSTNIDFTQSIAGRFCQRTYEQEDRMLSSEGQAWARLTNKCLSLALATTEITSCTDADDIAFNAFHDCAVQSGFCGVFWDERRALLDIFVRRTWLPLVRVARVCRRDDVDRFVNWSVQRVLN